MQYRPAGSLCWINKNGTTVSFYNTELVANVAVGDTFKIRSENAIYNITAVDSDTLIHINPAYAGNTVSASLFDITSDFTPNLNLTEINTGDADWPYHLTEGVIRKVDQYLSGALTIPMINVMTLSFAASTPTTSSATGTRGLIAFDTNHVYFCINNNSWKRVTLTVW